MKRKICAQLFEMSSYPVHEFPRKYEARYDFSNNFSHKRLQRPGLVVYIIISQCFRKSECKKCNSDYVFFSIFL